MNHESHYVCVNLYLESMPLQKLRMHFHNSHVAPCQGNETILLSCDLERQNKNKR